MRTSILLRSVILVALCFHALVLRSDVPAPGGGGWTFPTKLNSWTFADTNAWASDHEYLPISFTNLIGSKMGNVGGFSMMLDDTNGAWLNFNVIEGDGATNLTVNFGSLSFWFAPNWGSANTNQNGTGPGQWGRLFEVGAYTENADYGWWSLFLDEGGTNIYFSAQTNSGDSQLVTYLSAPVDWASNRWHNVVLTYSLTNSALYLDGQLAATGAVVSVFPGPEVLTNGFWIGSDSNGTSQARGLFDDIYTYDVPLDATNVAVLYGYNLGGYSINPYNIRVRIASGYFAPSFGPVFNAVSGGGGLTSVATNDVSCLTDSNIWITNLVVTPAGVGKMNVTFEIAGGTNGVLYDVFANSVLTFDPTPNTIWSWMGQGYHCVTYTLTNIESAECFLVLGTPLDSDGDGLTDAYENLVSRTDKNVWDTDGDGFSDGWEVMHGLNPLVNDNEDDPDHDGLTNLQEYQWGSDPNMAPPWEVWVSAPRGTSNLP